MRIAIILYEIGKEPRELCRCIEDYRDEPIHQWANVIFGQGRWGWAYNPTLSHVDHAASNDWTIRVVVKELR